MRNRDVSKSLLGPQNYSDWRVLGAWSIQIIFFLTRTQSIPSRGDLIKTKVWDTGRTNICSIEHVKPVEPVDPFKPLKPGEPEETEEHPRTSKTIQEPPKIS